MGERRAYPAPGELHYAYPGPGSTSALAVHPEVRLPRMAAPGDPRAPPPRWARGFASHARSGHTAAPRESTDASEGKPASWRRKQMLWSSPPRELAGSRASWIHAAEPVRDRAAGFRSITAAAESWSTAAGSRTCKPPWPGAGCSPWLG